MCTYNGSEFIQSQLESIFNQTLLPNEIIVSDDGSSDDTFDCLLEIAKRAPIEMRILQQSPRVGVTRNFERAIASCKGSIIVLSDQDDVWHINKIHQLVATFDSYPECGYVFSDASLIDAEGFPTGSSLWNTVGFNGSRRRRYQAGDQLQVMLRDGNFVYGMSIAFRSRHRGLVLPILANSPDCTHDTWIALLLSAANLRGVALSDTLVAYRQHERQVVGAGEFKSTSWRAIQRILSTNKRADIALAADYEAIANRLCESGINSSAVIMLAEKALHLRRRQEAISSYPLTRIMIVISELFSGRYARYSKSWSSAARDLVNKSR